jgi:putative spermidine/putrescine transport system permease protein
METLRTILRRGFMGLIALFIAAPLVVVIGVSFNATRRMSFPPTRFSLKWYKAFFENSEWLAALQNSLTISVLAAALSVLVALPLAYAVWRYNSRAAQALAAAGGGLFLLPGVVTALMFSAFWGVVGHVGRMENVILSHAVVMMGVPIAMLSVGFQSIDKALIEAARTMGAGDADAFNMVVRPAMAPYILCAFVYVFVLSLNEYLIAYMVAGFSVQTLPIKIFTAMRSGYEPTMCVGAVLFIVLGFSAFSLLAWIGDLPKLMGRHKPLEA